VNPTLGRPSAVGIYFEWAKLLGLDKLPSTRWGSFRDSVRRGLRADRQRESGLKPRNPTIPSWAT